MGGFSHAGRNQDQTYVQNLIFCEDVAVAISSVLPNKQKGPKFPFHLFRRRQLRPRKENGFRAFFACLTMFHLLDICTKLGVLCSSSYGAIVSVSLVQYFTQLKLPFKGRCLKRRKLHILHKKKFEKFHWFL
jgi:hypothetical protein